MGLRAYHKISERFEVSERLCTYMEKRYRIDMIRDPSLYVSALMREVCVLGYTLPQPYCIRKHARAKPFPFV